jgi:hypothetical protein
MLQEIEHDSPRIMIATTTLLVVVMLLLLLVLGFVEIKINACKPLSFA